MNNLSKTQKKQIAQQVPKDCHHQFPTNVLISFTAATACSALAVKFLKKGELALLTTLMVMPIALMCLNRSAKSKKFPWTKAPIF